MQPNSHEGNESLMVFYMRNLVHGIEAGERNMPPQ